MATPETRRQLLAAVQACEDKKGDDTRILELDPADSGLADFFLITSATNDRQVVAIADEIEFRLKKDFGLYATSVEGRRQAEWILLDYIDIVIHVFLAEKRAFYDIERLRKSARPLTPAQVDAEVDADLRAALASRTRAVRNRSIPKPTTQSKAKPAVKAVAAKSATQKNATQKNAKGDSTKVTAKPALKKASKPAAKKAAAKSAKKTIKKAAPKAAKKAPAKKATVKKSAAKPAIRSIHRQAAPKAAKKAAVKKAAPKAAPKHAPTPEASAPIMAAAAPIALGAKPPIVK
jgi:ribosome-associated protein